MIKHYPKKNSGANRNLIKAGQKFVNQKGRTRLVTRVVCGSSGEPFFVDYVDDKQNRYRCRAEEFKRWADHE